MLGVSVEEAPDHALILGMMLTCLILEKLDAALAQGDRHLHAFVVEYKVFRAWQKITNDPWVSDGLVGVFDFRVHRFVYLFANNLRQRCGSRCDGT